MAKWTFLFSHLVHFLMEKKFSIFRKNNFEALEKVPPSFESLSVYVETYWGEIVNLGSAFDLVGLPCHLLCPVWLGIAYGRKNEKGWNHC